MSPSGTLERVSKARLLIASTLVAFGVAASACSSPAASPTGTPSQQTTTASPTATPTQAIPVSKDLSGITVTGDKGKAPKVTFKTPFGLAETAVKVLIPGSTGRKVPVGGVVKVSYHGVNGRDGKVFDESFSGGEPIEFSTAQVIAGFKKGLEGQEVGSRVLIGVPGKDGYDASGGSQDGSIKVGDTILFVVDIVDASRESASGQAVQPKPGLPTVTIEGGKPKITPPTGAPPTNLQVQTLIKGDGAPVAATDAIMVKYVGMSWKTGKVFEEDFDKGETGALSSLIKGWQQGLLGQTVGSRVMLVIPPALAYPDGRREPSLQPGDTLIYVIDILYASKSAQ